jgi:hypothetical protein
MENPDQKSQEEPTKHRPSKLKKILAVVGLATLGTGGAAAAGAFDGATHNSSPEATAKAHPGTTPSVTAEKPTTSTPNGNGESSTPPANTPTTQVQTSPAPEQTTGNQEQLATNQDVINLVNEISVDAASVPGCTNDGNGNINCNFAIDPNNPNNGWALTISNGNTVDLVGPALPSSDPNASEAPRQELYISSAYNSGEITIDYQNPNISNSHASVSDSTLTEAQVNAVANYFATGGTNALNTLAQDPKDFDLSSLNASL